MPPPSSSLHSRILLPKCLLLRTRCRSLSFLINFFKCVHFRINIPKWIESVLKRAKREIVLWILFESVFFFLAPLNQLIKVKMFSLLASFLPNLWELCLIIHFQSPFFFYFACEMFFFLQFCHDLRWQIYKTLKSSKATTKLFHWNEKWRLQQYTRPIDSILFTLSIHKITQWENKKNKRWSRYKTTYIP